MKLRWLLGAGLALVGCSSPATRAEVAPPEPPKIEAPVPARADEAEAKPKPEPAVAAVRATFEETDAPPPADLRLALEKSGDGWAIRAERGDAILSLRRADDRETGKDRVALELGDEVEGPIVIEATRGKDLVTTRVVAHVSREGSARPNLVAHLTKAPRAVSGDAREAHDCRAHEDGFGGFAVVCRVSSPANAGSITGDDARSGVFESVGSTTLVRLDLDLGGEAVVSKAIAYNTHGRGVLVRAEASLAPGEKAPTLVVLSEARQQPVVRPIRHFCHLPRHVDVDHQASNERSML